MELENKFQIGDKVIVRYPSKNQYETELKGNIEEVLGLIGDDGTVYYKVLFSEILYGKDQTYVIIEKYISFEVSWYRENRLKGLLDEK